MRVVVFLILSSLLFLTSSCTIEDENAIHFETSHYFDNGFFSGKSIKGEVVKISSTPYTTVELRIDYENDNYETIDTEYLTVSGLSALNQPVEFCSRVDDSICNATIYIHDVR